MCWGNTNSSCLNKSLETTSRAPPALPSPFLPFLWQQIHHSETSEPPEPLEGSPVLGSPGFVLLLLRPLRAAHHSLHLLLSFVLHFSISLFSFFTSPPDVLHLWHTAQTCWDPLNSFKNGKGWRENFRSVQVQWFYDSIHTQVNNSRWITLASALCSQTPNMQVLKKKFLLDFTMAEGRVGLKSESIGLVAEAKSAFLQGFSTH